MRKLLLGRAPLLPLALACASCAAPVHPPELRAPDYPRFDGLAFEPSAAAYDPETGRFLVLSDKDSIVPLRP